MTPQKITIAGKTFVRALPQIVRHEIDNNHYYWVNNEFCPAVTAILDAAAPVGFVLRQFWQTNTQEDISEKLTKAQDFGSKMHIAFEKLLLGETLDLGANYPLDREKRILMNFHDWFHEYLPVDYVAEHTVASTKYKIAGTLDFAGFLKDKKFWIIDFKTAANIYFNHELQIAAYKALFEEMYGIKVDRVGILRVGTKSKQGYEFKTDDPESKSSIKTTFNDFLRVYKIYLTMNGGKLPTPPEIRSYPATLQLLKEEVKKNEKESEVI